MTISLPGGMMKTLFGATVIPSFTSLTGMEVVLERSAVSMLSCAGARCWIRTKAIPGLAGRVLNNCVNASSPPADAPTPTTGNWLFLDDLVPGCLVEADEDLSFLEDSLGAT